MILLRRRSGGVKFYTMDNLPKFANFGRGGCLRRRGNNEYWRDGGAWGVDVKIVAGNVTCDVSLYSGEVFVDSSVMGSNITVVREWVSLGVRRLGVIINNEHIGAWLSMIILLVIIPLGLWKPEAGLITAFLGLVGIFALGLFTPLTLTFIIIFSVISIIIGVALQK